MTGSSSSALFITPVDPNGSFGGTATVSRNLSALFAETMSTQVCCLRSDTPGAYPIESDGATVLSGPVPAWLRQLKFFFDIRGQSFAHRQFQRRRVAQGLQSLLARTRPGLIVLDHIFSAWVLDLLPPQAKVIFIAHDDMVAYADSLLALHPPLSKKLRFQRLRPQYRKLQNRILQGAGVVLTMTEEDAHRMRGSARGPVETAPLFFEFEDPGEAPVPMPDSLLVTGSFDTWEKRLGLHRFLHEIIPGVARDRPAINLTIAGRIPEPLHAGILAAHPATCIVHRPTPAKLRALMQNATVATVLDLQASGLKIKTVELASAGLPIVGWPPGLEGTGLIHEKSCLQAQSRHDFIFHLQRLFEDAALRERLGREARRTMLHRYSRESARRRLQATLSAHEFPT